MSSNTSRLAYRSYYEVLDRAVDSPAGLRVECPTEGDAAQYRTRLNYARTLDRELNRASRDQDDPRYGLSDYDELVFRIKCEGERWWVYIEPDAVPVNIEELPCST